MELWKGRIKQGISIYSKNDLSVYAGNATLFIITSMFPLIMLIIAIVNLLPGYSSKDAAEIIFLLIPDLGPIKELVESAMENLNSQSGGLLASVSAITTLWAASKGVGALQKGFNQLHHDEEENGIIGIVKRLVFTILLVIQIPALLIFTMLGDSILESICKAIGRPKSDFSFVLNITSLGVVIVALLVIVLLFAYLTAKKRTLRSQLPGGIFSGIALFVFTELFSFFIPKFYHASSLYGSLASLFLIMMWFRFIVMILFAGGVINKLLEGNNNN